MFRAANTRDPRCVTAESLGVKDSVSARQFPVAYGDIQANPRSNESIASSVMAGLQFENARIGDRKLQVLAEYFPGPSPNGQFYTQNTEWFGLGVHLYY